MAECSRCGANTDLHLIGIPICLRCDEIVELMAADEFEKCHARALSCEETKCDRMMTLSPALITMTFPAFPTAAIVAPA
jgi:hypothetical protein